MHMGLLNGNGMVVCVHSHQPVGAKHKAVQEGGKVVENKAVINVDMEGKHISGKDSSKSVKVK